MSEVQPTPRRLPRLPARLLQFLLAAFGAGLLLFLLVWLDQRNDKDFFKPDYGPGSAAGEPSALPAPLPADVAGVSGLGDDRDAGRDNADARSADQPRLVNEPPPPPPPAPAAQQQPGQAPAPLPAIADIAVPVPVSRPAPAYPREALNRRIGGTVRVLAVVGPDGSVERMEVSQSSGNRHLDRAAMEAVRRWKFQPATRNGQPVSAEVILPLEFDPNA